MISQVTSLPITTAVTCPTTRIHPAIIAQAAATAGLLAGLYLHRRTRIEQTAGPRESLVHHLMFGETGVPALTAHRVTADEDQPGAREPEAGHDLRRHPGGVQDEQAAQEI